MKIPIALQLYSVRNELEADSRGTLEAVAEMGYRGVEFAGPPRHEPEELRGLLDALGLSCCGWHTAYGSVQEERVGETVAFNKTLGNNRLIVPAMPEDRRGSRADWLELAAFFNRLSERLRVHGMSTGYHNHNFEVAPLDGETPWDTFFGGTKEEVIMQLDLGNAMAGG